MESGRDKNITFRVSGGGKVNFPAAAGGGDGKLSENKRAMALETCGDKGYDR